jgi:hypothetical protein
MEQRLHEAIPGTEKLEKIPRNPAIKPSPRDFIKGDAGREHLRNQPANAIGASASQPDQDSVNSNSVKQISER